MALELQPTFNPLPLLPDTEQGRARVVTQKRSLATAMAVATLAALALCVAMGSQAHKVPLVGYMSSAIHLAETETSKDPCENFSKLELKKVLHSNLGNHSPDDGPEGLVYEAVATQPGKEPIPLIITVNATHGYKIAHPRDNGIHGAYGVITLKQGTEADFRVKVLNSTTLKPIKLPKMALTFFDLDTHAGGTNVEYLKVGGYSEYLVTKSSEVEVKDLPDGRKKFSGSTPSTKGDQPEDPYVLTVQQKNRAVTFEFQDSEKLDVTLGNTNGKDVRYFFFVARPSVKCVLAAEEAGARTAVTTTTTATTTKSAATPRSDLKYFFFVMSLVAMTLS